TADREPGLLIKAGHKPLILFRAFIPQRSKSVPYRRFNKSYILLCKLIGNLIKTYTSVAFPSEREIRDVEFQNFRLCPAFKYILQMKHLRILFKYIYIFSAVYKLKNMSTFIR